jgi:hypothetical protein
MNAVELSDALWETLATIPHHHNGQPFARDAACFLFAAAAKAALPQYRFVAGGAMTPGSIAYGWGVIHNPAAGQFIVCADREVDEDGEYCGHCWVTRYNPGSLDLVVVDVMEPYGGASFVEGEICYASIGSLARSISREYRAEINEAKRRVRKRPDLVARIREFAQAAEGAA